MGRKTKGQPETASETINHLKEGDFLEAVTEGTAPDLVVEEGESTGAELSTGPATAVTTTQASGYVDVVVTGATLNHDGVKYPASHRVKLPRRTADRLAAIGLVRPLSELRQSLQAKENAGLSVTTAAEGLKIIAEA